VGHFPTASLSLKWGANPALAGSFEYENLRAVRRKIRHLITDLKQAGFVQVPGGKGSHRKFQHPKLAG
jgi:hypothetical protein